LADVEFAADDVIAGAGVAADVDAFDVDSRTFFNREGHVDGLVDLIAIAARPYHREGIAAARDLYRQVLHGFLDGFGVIDAALAGPKPAVQRRRVDRRNIGDDLDLTELVAVALLDRVGD